MSTGVTIARASAVCKKGGTKKVLAVATHGIFTGWFYETLLEDILRQIITTNTIPSFRLEQTRIKVRVGTKYL